MGPRIDYPERLIRIVAGLILGNVGFANPGFAWLAGSPVIQPVLVLVGLYLFSTGLAGVCPLRRVRRYLPKGLPWGGWGTAWRGNDRRSAGNGAEGA